MVKHVILWKLKEMPEDEMLRVKADMKSSLEGLRDKIPGLLHVKVNIEPLPSSNADVMLDTLFEDEDALKAYQKHPEHVAVADDKVRPYTAERFCMDYIIDE